MATLFLLIGIPGSGKSTWVRENNHKWKNTEVIEPDAIRRDMGDVSDQKVNGSVWFAVKTHIIYCLKNNISVVLDATNLHAAERKKMLSTIRDGVGDFDLRAKIFKVDPEIAKERIKLDIERGINRANVPPKIVDNMQDAFLFSIGELRNEGVNIVEDYVS